MKKQGAARVLRFAVTGALLGGGVGIGCAGKDRPNDDLHVNPGPEERPADAPSDVHVNTAEEAEPDAAPEPADNVIVNTVKEPEPGAEEPRSVNTAKEPDTGKKAGPKAVKTNPGPQ